MFWRKPDELKGMEENRRMTRSMTDVERRDEDRD